MVKNRERTGAEGKVKPTFEEFILAVRKERKAWNYAWVWATLSGAVSAAIVACWPHLDRYPACFVLFGAGFGVAVGIGLWIGLRDPEVDLVVKRLFIASIAIASLCCGMQASLRWALGTSKRIPDAAAFDTASRKSQSLVTRQDKNAPVSLTGEDMIPLPPSLLSSSSPDIVALRKAFKERQTAVQTWKLEEGGTQTTALQVVSGISVLLAQWALATCSALLSVGVFYQMRG